MSADYTRTDLSEFIKNNHGQLKLFLIAFCTEVDSNQLNALIQLFDIEISPDQRDTCPEIVNIFADDELFIKFLVELCITDYTRARDQTGFSPEKTDLVKFNWLKAARAYVYAKKAADYDKKSRDILATNYTHAHVSHERWGARSFVMIFFALLVFLLICPALRINYNNTSISLTNFTNVTPLLNATSQLTTSTNVPSNILDTTVQRWDELNSMREDATYDQLSEVTEELDSYIARIMQYF